MPILPSKKKKIRLDLSRLPSHVAIIPDGNRRWARKRALGNIFGHREGAKRIKEIIIYANSIGIRYLSFYVFSTENWSRSTDEVSGLMGLILEFLKNADRELEGSDVRINIIGVKDSLAEDIKKEIVRIEEKTGQNKGTVLNLFLNYGGRQEILDAAAKAASQGIVISDAQSFRQFLYDPQIPDPDLIIRTSGELRLSNFLLWESAYAELLFTEKMWPDFTKTEFDKAIFDYQQRIRRYGGY